MKYRGVFLAILMNDHVAPWLLITAKIIWILIHALNIILLRKFDYIASYLYL
jgi:hypothetical protein